MTRESVTNKKVLCSSIFLKLSLLVEMFFMASAPAFPWGREIKIPTSVLHIICYDSTKLLSQSNAVHYWHPYSQESILPGIQVYGYVKQRKPSAGNKR